MGVLLASCVNVCALAFVLDPEILRSTCCNKNDVTHLQPFER